MTKARTTTKGVYSLTATAPTTPGATATYRVHAPAITIKKNKRKKKLPALTSKTRTITTQATTPPPPPPVDTTPPPVPTGLDAVPGDTTITLTWNAVTGPNATDLAGYTVYQATTPTGPFTNVNIDPQTSTTRSITGLTNGVTYHYAVTSTDTTGNESARSTTVTETPDNYTGPNHCGPLTGSEVWRANTVHVLDCTVTVPAGLTLTIRPGSVVKAAASQSLDVLGHLTANGTAAQPVTFTHVGDDSVGGDTEDNGPASPPPGAWAGISMRNGQLRLDHTRVRYAQGVSATLTYQQVPDEAVVITNSRFEHLTEALAGDGLVGFSQGAVSIRQYGDATPDTDQIVFSDNVVTNNPNSRGLDVYTTVPARITDNSFTNNSSSIEYEGPINQTDLTGNSGNSNTYSAMKVRGTLTADLNLPVPGMPWVLGYVEIPDGRTMHVAAGTPVKFDQVNGLYPTLVVDGTLTANGTAAQPVTFTHVGDDSVGGDTEDNGPASPPPGAWAGISMRNGQLRLDHTRVRYAQGVSATLTYQQVPDEAVVITNSRFEHLTEALAGDGLVGFSQGAVSIRQYGDATPDTDQIVFSDNVVTNNPNSRGLDVYTTVPARITDNSFTNNSSSIEYEGPINQTDLTGNSGNSNTYSAMKVRGTLTADLNLPVPGMPWVLGYVEIPDGRTMHVAAGTPVKFDQVNGLYPTLVVDGTLTANGTAAQPVTFTHVGDDSVGGDTEDNGATSPPPGAWAGISMRDGASATLIGTTIRYASTALSVAEGGGAEIHGKILDSTVGVSSSGFVDATMTDWGSPTGPAPFGDGTAITGTGIAVVPWIGLQPPPDPPASPPPVQTVQQTTCRQFLFIGIRGSGETPFSDSEHPGYTADERLMGNRVRGIYDGFIDSAAGAMNTTPEQARGIVRGIGLKYPALGLPIRDKTVGIDEYVESANTGMLNLIRVLEQEVARCGSSGEKIILAGYSQGAWVIHAVLAYLAAKESDLVTPSHIAGVLLLADPHRLPNSAEAHGGTASASYGGLGTTFGSVLLGFSAWVARYPVIGPGLSLGSTAVIELTPRAKQLIYSQPIPDDLTDITYTFCNAHDPVCATLNTPLDSNVHDYGAATGNDTDRRSMGNWLVNKLVFPDGPPEF